MSDTGCIIFSPGVVNELSVLCQPFWEDQAARTYSCLPSGFGQLYEIRPGTFSQSDWDQAIDAMGTGGGNVIKFLPGDHTGYYDVKGQNGDPSGIQNSHNCITSDPGAVIHGIESTNINDSSTFIPAIDLVNVRYWDVVNLTIVGGVFGLRMQASGGDPNDYAVVANIDISETQFARLVFQAYEADHTQVSSYINVYDFDLHTGDPNETNFAWASEGIYIGTASGVIDETHDINFYYGEIYDLTADAIDIKPGVYNIYGQNLIIHDIDLNHVNPLNTNDRPVAGISIADNGGNLGTGWAGFGIDGSIQFDSVRMWNIIGDPSGLFGYPVHSGRDSVWLSNFIAWDYTSDAMARLRPTSTDLTQSSFSIACSTTTADKAIFTMFDPLGASPNVVNSWNLDSATTANFVGPTNGLADAGDGEGSGFAPIAGSVASGSGCTSDATGCTSDGTIGALNTAASSQQTAMYQTVYYTDWSSGTIDPQWDIYDSPGHAGNGLRTPNAVSIVQDSGSVTGGEVLQIEAQMVNGVLESGGMQVGVPITYGRTSARVRVDDDASQATSGVLILWPQANNWPDGGEIDWFETWANRDTRTPVEANNHWGDPPGVDNVEGINHPGIDGSVWHVYEMVWTPNLITVSVDGGTPVVLSSDPARIPDWPMQQTIQLDAMQPTMFGVVQMHVDWIRVEALI